MDRDQFKKIVVSLYERATEVTANKIQADIFKSVLEAAEADKDGSDQALELLATKVENIFLKAQAAIADDPAHKSDITNKCADQILTECRNYVSDNPMPIQETKPRRRRARRHFRIS